MIRKTMKTAGLLLLAVSFCHVALRAASGQTLEDKKKAALERERIRRAGGKVSSGTPGSSVPTPGAPVRTPISPAVGGTLAEKRAAALERDRARRGGATSPGRNAEAFELTDSEQRNMRNNLKKAAKLIEKAGADNDISPENAAFLKKNGPKIIEALPRGFSGYQAYDLNMVLRFLLNAHPEIETDNAKFNLLAAYVNQIIVQGKMSLLGLKKDSSRRGVEFIGREGEEAPEFFHGFGPEAGSTGRPRSGGIRPLSGESQSLLDFGPPPVDRSTRPDAGVLLGQQLTPIMKLKQFNQAAFSAGDDWMTNAQAKANAEVFVAANEGLYVSLVFQDDAGDFKWGITEQDDFTPLVKQQAYLYFVNNQTDNLTEEQMDACAEALTSHIAQQVE